MFREYGPYGYALRLVAIVVSGLLCAAAGTGRSAGGEGAIAGELGATIQDRETRPWLVFEGARGPGRGKLIVLVSGDEEYRSEEALPQLARILAERHGFRCVVLFAIDPERGTINPNITTNIPGLEHLREADLLLIATRFRDLPDDQMKHVDDYLQSGRPVIGMRTATHAFRLSSTTYRRYSFDSRVEGWEGGFGRRVLGETWIDHHGAHGKQGTRGVAAPGQARHPILRGIVPGSIFGPTDVYRVKLPLPDDSVPIVLGEVTESLDPSSKAVEGPLNNPMMPIAWTKTYALESGRRGRVFTTTMGAAEDLLAEGTRRMLVNAVYWALGMEGRIPAKSDVRLVEEYRPSAFGFRRLEDWRPGKRPSDLPR